MKGAKRVAVDRALRNAVRQVRAVSKAVNQQASKSLGRGRYEEAEELVHLARSIAEFVGRVEEVRQQWKDLMASSSAPRESAEGDQATPLWKYYHPILQVLTDLGGEATRGDLEKRLAPLVERLLSPADLRPGPRGTAQWKVMLRRARRPMTKQGFLDPESRVRWRITAEGRRVAHAEPGAPKP